jgi:cob(I)alamin adenosyltransferase
MSRVSKNDLRLAAYADVDEANSALGVALALGGLPDDGRGAADPGAERALRRRRRPLHAGGPEPEYPPLRVEESYVDRLEAACDEYNDALAKLRSFVLPGARRARRCCTWRAPSSAGPSARPGLRSRSTPTR